MIGFQIIILPDKLSFDSLIRQSGRFGWKINMGGYRKNNFSLRRKSLSTSREILKSHKLGQMTQSYWVLCPIIN